MNSTSTPSEWREFLSQLVEAKDLCAGATEEVLVKVEARLKVKLPPSYRAFLGASNGVENVSQFVPVLKPVEKVKWFAREHRDWVQAYTDPMAGVDQLLPAEQEYFDYSSESQGRFDTTHLAQTLCISEMGDSAVLLLNPMVVWPDGEWEAWFFANWIPGAVRYRSFAEWMRHEAAEFRQEPYLCVQTPGELPVVYRDGPSKANRRIRPREEVLTLEEVRKRLTSKTRSHRVKAVQYLCRLGGPEAVAILLDLLKNDYDHHVRCEAAESLGKLRAPEAIVPLIAETAEYSRVSGSAIHGLGYFNDERSAQRLVEIVEENGLSGCVAAHILAQRKDARGVKALVKLMLSKDPKDQHTGEIAGRYIAQFEEAGFAALEPLATHAEAATRQRVLLGISDLAIGSQNKGLRAKALKVLEQCLEREAGGRMHQWLASCVKAAGGYVSWVADDPFAGG